MEPEPLGLLTTSAVLVISDDHPVAKAIAVPSGGKNAALTVKHIQAGDRSPRLGA